ncbi:MAG: nodulation protein NfeD [Dehalococcoidales bacterium]|jgi:membrane-bound serine protease (ClpP class)
MIKIRRIVLLLTVLLLAVSLAGSALAQTSGGVYVLTIKGTINPVLVDYVERGINIAEDNNAAAVIIQLDTPGGLDTAMRDIVKLMVNAHVPVVVYVAPSGARAASAGVFITMAAHVAVMAPNTAIGAAHPVSVGEEGEQTMSDTMEEKVVNDAAAYIRSLAESHGRNMDWAEKAVRESVSATEHEALELNVIDMIAPDLPSLLNQLDGRQVTLLNGQQITLQTKNAEVVDTQMKFFEKFLYTIADPNIAYILLSVATLGIMAELFNPGLIFPGIIGGIAFLMAFYSLGMLPVNYAGILLLVLAVGLFIGELLTASFGLFTAGGVVSLVAGSIMLFKGASPVFRISPWLIAVVCILVSGFLIFLVQRAVQAHRKQAVTGREELINKTATVRAALNPEGVVFYKGERWTAVSESGAIGVGEEVTIKRMDGLTLYVVKKEAPPADIKNRR